MFLPFASSSFAFRRDSTPADLLRRGPPAGPRPRLLAYLASNCVPHREDFFRTLRGRAGALGLGGVDALGCCDGSGAAGCATGLVGQEEIHDFDDTNDGGRDADEDIYIYIYIYIVMIILMIIIVMIMIIVIIR